MHKLLLSLIMCAAMLAALPVLAADRPIDFHAQGARVHASFWTGEALTLPSQASPVDVTRGFLSERHAGRTLDGLVVTGQLNRDGLTHVRLGQQIAGLDVYGTYVKAAVNQHGELVHLIENLQTPPSSGLLLTRLSPEDALAAALAENHPGHGGLAPSGLSGNTTTFANDGFFFRDPVATRVAIPMQGGGMEEGFLVETWENDSNLLYHTLVSRTGRVLGVELRTNTDSYNIFPDHPGNSTQTIVAGPGAGNAESPVGWLSGSQTSVQISGNNSFTYLDTDANNSPDPGGVSITDGNFVTVADLASDPSTAGNKEVAAQSLFYLCNTIHDKLYRHGFVESEGNFQVDNFGNGGASGDPVLCEAQDGSGTNNANFSTPSDGSSGRMQMYLWTTTTPRRDGDVDSDIPWHEYGHGLTWRMIGGMSGPMSGAIGEGNGDVLAILTNDNDVMGEYSTNDPVGIRSQPYSGYTRTYGDFGGSSVHFDGEIYAATLWDLKNRYQANSISVDTLWDDMVGGMSFTPSGPAFEDMRNGILAQAAGSGRECLIWESFAAFGIGDGARAQIKGGGPFGGGNVTITESFALPPECGGPGGDGGGTCSEVGEACKNNGDCCPGLSCTGRGNSKTCA